MNKGILSFGFIFSLIVAAVVIFVGTWGVKKIIEFNEGNRISLSVKEIQTTVEEIWQAHESKRIETFYFPSSVKVICFINKTIPRDLDEDLKEELKNYGPFLKNHNLFLLPYGLKNKYRIRGYYNITCGNVQCIEFQSFCIRNVDGKIKISFESVDGKVNISKA
jgi:hypothetical protein